MVVNSTKLTGLKPNTTNAQPQQVNTLTPPDQLLNKPQVSTESSNDNNKSNDNKKSVSTQSDLSNTDKLNLATSLIGAGIAGAVASAKVVPNIGILGEGLRHVQVAATVQDLKMTDYNNNYASIMNNMQNMNMNGGAYGNTGYGNTGYGNTGYGNNNGYVDPSMQQYGNTGYGNTGYGNNNGYVDPSMQQYGNTGYGNQQTGVVNNPGSGSTEVYVNRARVEGFRPMNTQEMSLALRNIGKGGIQGAKFGVIIGGGVSSLVNMYNVATGKEKGPEAVGAVAADTITSGISGTAGALAGGFTSLGLGMIGVGGVPGMIMAVGLGTVGAIGTQFLLQKSGLYDSLKEKVSGMFSGK